MQVPLRIIVRGMPHSEALEAIIRKDAARLETVEGRILSCRVTVELSSGRHSPGREYQVRIDLRTPHDRIVQNHAHNEDPHVALRDAFQLVKGKLEDAARIARGEVEPRRRAPSRATRK